MNQPMRGIALRLSRFDAERMEQAVTAARQDATDCHRAGMGVTAADCMPHLPSKGRSSRNQPGMIRKAKIETPSAGHALKWGVV